MYDLLLSHYHTQALAISQDQHWLARTKRWMLTHHQPSTNPTTGAVQAHTDPAACTPVMLVSELGSSAAKHHHLHPDCLTRAPTANGLGSHYNRQQRVSNIPNQLTIAFFPYAYRQDLTRTKVQHKSGPRQPTAVRQDRYQPSHTSPVLLRLTTYERQSRVHAPLRAPAFRVYFKWD
jgi:hypothetical protein